MVKRLSVKIAAEQINGREGETATLLSRCLFTLSLCGGGFAPRHLSRSAFLAYYGVFRFLLQYQLKFN